MTVKVPCKGCGGIFPEVDGPTHAYMLSSPGCWAAYGAVLAREYQNPALFASSHRMTVDAYALQHPGDPEDRRAHQSIWLHYGALMVVFEDGRSFADAHALLKRLSATTFPVLPPAPAQWPLTVLDLEAADAARHAAVATHWAKAAFDGWASLQELMRQRLAAL